MRYGRIARVAGEAFDADQIEWRCEECGKNEYSCECEPEEDDMVLSPNDGTIPAEETP